MKNLIRMVAIVLTVATFATGLASCGSDGGDTLSVYPANLTFNAFVGDKSVSVSGPEWSASVDQPWVSISPEAGTNGTITVSVTANDTGSTRSATLTVSNAAGSKTVGIIQAVAGVAVVEPENLEFDFTGDVEKHIAVESESQWSVASNEAWLTVAKVSETEFTAHAALNEGDARNATITVTNTVGESFVSVTQAANPGEILTYGYAGYYGNYYNPQAGNFSLMLQSKRQSESGDYVINLDIYSALPSTAGRYLDMIPGTYTPDSSRDLMTIYTPYSYVTRLADNGQYELFMEPISSGTLKIEGNHENYTITVDFVLGNGADVRALYTGPILINNDSPTGPISTFSQNLSLTMSGGAYNAGDYRNTTSYVLEYMTDGVYYDSEQDFYMGDGHVFIGELLTPSGTTGAVPNGTYSFVTRDEAYNDAFTTIEGFLSYGRMYGAWVIEVADGKEINSGPITDGSIVVSGNGTSVVLDGLDDMGNSMVVSCSRVSQAPRKSLSHSHAAYGSQTGIVAK